MFPRRAGSGFQLENLSYESVDAETLWCMVRHLKPRRIVELGSGWSTLLPVGPLEANRRDQHGGELRVFDPYPRPPLVMPLPGLTELVAVPGADVRLERFLELEERDVLFVDTPHTVKAGGEVNRIVLEILPGLGSSVVVHFHDVLLPYEYPECRLRYGRFFWTEQYLLQAFLACNDRFEVPLAANALAQTQPDRLAALVSSFRAGVQPGAFWIRRL